jgi:predicted ATP-dependent endonuclease of OLD family
MFISDIEITNFRLFGAEAEFKINAFNVPDGETPGSGINVFVGENGCGKTTLLDALSLPLLEYKSDSFSIDDMNAPEHQTTISVLSNNEFTVKGTMPKSSFQAKGFMFKASVRSRNAHNYFSSIIVSDQLYIKADSAKPADGSPDLRVSVNNPFSGKRFNENDILFLDKNRYYQTKTGSFNQTRFDRLMEDLDYKYIKSSDVVADINAVFSAEVRKANVSSDYLTKSIAKFKDITGITINLDFVDNYHPFREASFVQRKDNHQQIKLGSMGSGYEMIFSLIYSYQLALQSKKQLIVLIDEPELHMHPALQEKLIGFLLDISKNAQVFISTHSALLIKQLSGNQNAKIMILQQQDKPIDMAERKLPYLSASETNYLAFGLATEEYHNELYEYLKSLHGEDRNYKNFDKLYFIDEKGESKNYPWRGHPNEVSLNTFVRNQIHHSGDNGIPAKADLKASIEAMRSYI